MRNAFVLGLAVAAGACASGGPAPYRADPPAPRADAANGGAPAPVTVAPIPLPAVAGMPGAGNAGMDGVAMPVSREGAVIQPGDSLDISVFGHQELSRVVSVQPDGSIAFPFLGRLAVKGRAVEAIALDIATALEKDYSLREPHVSVSIDTFATRAVYILGRVRQSGSHPLVLTRPLTLLQLLSMAGGFEEDADRSRVLVQRTNADGTRLVFTVNLTGVERQGDLSNDIALSDGDTVFVPRTDEVSVLGQVTESGSFVMKAGQPLTLLRAVARSKGFTRLAKPAAIVWVRRAGEGVETVTVDAEAILAGRAADPVLSPGDILFVPERAW